ncbi:MBL fold metallo-hydrolase [Streptomyces sp. NPDC059866]|uniref:MBL fold metallo-hydrolase n=1 Tax=Streptomyces sp. NPDC059866 TaxID=3346978 RepID=UPI00364A0EFE
MSATPAPGEAVRLGDLKVRYLPDGIIRAHPLQAYPEHVHLARDSELKLLDEDGMLLLSVGALLVETPAARILIDTGIGPRVIPIPSPDPALAAGVMAGGQLLDSLAEANLRPDDIDAVLLSHLHADHVGWITSDDVSTEPTFPNAEYFVGVGEFDFWGQPANMARLTAPTSRQYSVIGSRRHDLRTDDQPYQGIEALLTPGHTPGHVSFVLSGEGTQRAIVVGDAMHTAAEVLHPDMCWTGDLDPQAAVASRHALVGELSRPGTVTIGPHFTGTVFPTRAWWPGSDT